MWEPAVRSRSLDLLGVRRAGLRMARGGESALEGAPSRGAAPGRVEAAPLSGISDLALREAPQKKKPLGHAQRLSCLRKTRPGRPRGAYLALAASASVVMCSLTSSLTIGA